MKNGSDTDEDIEEWMDDHDLVKEEAIRASDLPADAKESLITMQQLFDKKLLQWEGSMSESEDSDDEEEQPQPQPQPEEPEPERTIEEMIEQEDEEALFEKAKTDYPAGTQIRLHWSDQDQEGVVV